MVKHINSSYDADPQLLRGHDLVAMFWADDIRDQADPEFESVALVVMAGTAVTQHSGTQYDGRPIAQGSLRPEDYEAYFAYLDSFGDQSTRARALLFGPTYLAAIAMMRHLNNGTTFELPREARMKKPEITSPLLKRIASYWADYAQRQAIQLAEQNRRTS